MKTTPTRIRHTRPEWVEIICANWRMSIEGIIQTGRDLAAAKEELSGDDFMKMVSDDLPFSLRAAQQLMAVANHPVIGNAKPASLPASWSVLSELTKLSESDFKDAQVRGLITAETGKREARAVATAYGLQDDGGTVGDVTKPAMLPAPNEARKIARETGRFVAASDGYVYSGATKEEGETYRSKRNVAFDLLEAINTLAEAPDPRDFMRTSERHWFVDFRPGSIDDARKWLGNLKEAMEIVDA